MNARHIITLFVIGMVGGGVLMVGLTGVGVPFIPTLVLIYALCFGVGMTYGMRTRR